MTGYAPYIEGMGSATYRIWIDGDTYMARLDHKHGRSYFYMAHPEDGLPRRLLYADRSEATTAALRAVSQHPTRGDRFGAARMRAT